jgi:putative phosphoserine phosphatase/1-acylglycerol-3-phosphate O-acyltransferase
MKELVILDLDGVIIDGQSQQIFLNYIFREKLVSLFFYSKIYLWFVFYKIGLAKNPQKIMDYAFSFLKDKKIGDIGKIVDTFFTEKLEKFIFPEIIGIIKEHKEKNREMLIVSNAVDIFVKRIAYFLEIKNYICTKLEVVEGKFTGKISGDIIYGKNKVNMASQFIMENSLNFDNSYGYSDHISDLNLLLMVSNPYAVNPDKLLLKEAKRRNWPVLKFKSIF